MKKKSKIVALEPDLERARLHLQEDCIMASIHRNHRAQAALLMQLDALSLARHTLEHTIAQAAKSKRLKPKPRSSKKLILKK